MSALRETQEAFLVRLKGHDALPGRLEAYRRNYRENFRAALALGFPVIHQLAGDDAFAALSREFQDAHPSRSGDLHEAGECFPAWLDAELSAGAHAYFGDVARLERAREDVLRAATAPILEASALQAIPAEALPSQHLPLIPAAALLESRFPVLSIWRAHQAGGDPGLVDPAGAGERVLIHRTSKHCELVALGLGEYVFLAALAAGRSLGEALDAALEREEAFDVAEALRRAMARGLYAASGSGEGRATA